MSDKVIGWLKLIFIFAVLPIVGLIFLWRDRCQQTEILKLVSPRQDATAYLSTKDCGTAIKPASIVDIESAGKREKAAVLQGTTGVELRWSNDQELTIIRPKDVVLVQLRHKVLGVSVSSPE